MRRGANAKQSVSHAYPPAPLPFPTPCLRLVVCQLLILMVLSLSVLPALRQGRCQLLALPFLPHEF